MIKQLGLYLHTLRHLRTEQVIGRFVFILHRPRVDTSPAPRIRRMRSDGVSAWVMPLERQATMVGPSQFRFLGLDGDLQEIGWDGPQREKLWRYNQHYFDDLNAIDADERKNWHNDLILRWVRSNPPAKGNGWEPYPTSLRIVNWVKWAMRGCELPKEALQSLAVQTRWLSKRLEYHLLGNHLFANAKALVYAGMFFEGEEAGRWLELGLSILKSELQEQILSDGGHFERSPMYHILAMEDLLDLINLAQSQADGSQVISRRVLGEWRACVINMAWWLKWMCHPDGEISFFNDAAMALAPEPSEVMLYADKVLGAKVMATSPKSTFQSLDYSSVIVHKMSESGYIRVEAGRAVLLLDAAPIGPDYLPGHAHADTLSFELSIDGKRVMVNSGTSQYGDGPERLRQRGTAAHNTVVVDGLDSSEVWSGFRVARRAHPFDLVIEQVRDGVRIVCSHDGYRRLPGKPTHQRTWVITQNSLVVEDRLKGTDGRLQSRNAFARYHLHPDFAAEELRDARWTLKRDGVQIAQVEVQHGQAERWPSTWHPEFGRVETNACMNIVLADGQATVQFTWRDIG